MRRTLVAVAAIGALGALPAAAQAHKYTAYAGEAARPAGSPGSAEINAFEPAKLKVRAGDSVKYLNNAFHTVSVLAKGSTPPPLAIPAAGQTYSGINDPQGHPFFFNGMQKFEYNPAVFGPVGSTTVGDGKMHSSGAFGSGGPGKPGKYTLKFAKKHAKGANTNSQVKKLVRKQNKKHYADANAATKIKPPADTVYAGVEKRNATLLAYAPQSLAVKAGTTVSFVQRSPTEAHNLVFGPQDYVDSFTSSTDLLPLGPGAPNQVSPPFIYGSEPLSVDGAYDYSGQNYGDGFLWTPLMDDQPGNPPAGLPGVEKIKFTKAGTYSYFCAIHGRAMSGTVVVN